MPIAQLERAWQWAWRVPRSCSGCSLLVGFCWLVLFVAIIVNTVDSACGVVGVMPL